MTAQPQNIAQTQLVQSGNIMADLSTLGLLAISGDDAVTFLQGQVTNDVNLVTESNSHYTGYCNAKGRLLALFFAFQYNNTLHLSLDTNLTESIKKRLTMYVLRAKVTIEAVQTQVKRIAVAGEQAESILASFFKSLPQNPYESITDQGTTIIRLPLVKPAYQLITTIENGNALWETLQDSFTPVNQATWHWLEIQSGLPEITTDTQATFVPQMVNLDSIGGINFKKGCYTGQEIVARTHYLGKIKRKTLLGSLKLTSDEMPNAGDSITDATQQEVGHIVRAIRDENNNLHLLFECRLDSADNPLNWKNQPITKHALPYSIVEKEE